MNASEKDTGTLYTELLSSPDLDRFLDDNKDSFCYKEQGETLKNFLNRYPFPKAEIARKTGISDVYLYQIMAGKRSLSRDKIITMCIVLGTPLEEVQHLLKGCGEAELYARSRRDAIVIKGISTGKSLEDIEAMLVSEGEKKL